MQSTSELSAELKELALSCKALVAKVVEGMEPEARKVTLLARTNVCDSAEQRGKLFVIRDGTLICQDGDRIMLLFEEGDLVGLESFYAADHVSIRTEFAVKADQYDLTVLLEAVRNDPQRYQAWNKYLACYSSFVRSALGALISEAGNPNPDFHNYSAGDVIIEQGSQGDKVFTMIEGHADVLVDGVKVGEILKDEIFGALAALTGTARTASVVATTGCMLLSLPSDNFLELVETRPTTIQKMVEDMARAIVALNKKVVEGSYIKG